MAYATEAGFTIRDLTLMETQGTMASFFMAGRLYGKAIASTALCMNFGNFWPYFREMMAYAISTESNNI
jgi:hypothetical protein